MFRVELRDIEKIYEHIAQGHRGVIGTMPFTQAPLSQLETYIFSLDNRIVVRSALYPADEYESDEPPDELWVPHKSLKRSLGQSFAIQTQEDQQMIAHKDGVEYIMQWMGKPMDGILELSAEHTKGSQDLFVRNMKTYSTVLEKMVNGLYRECQEPVPSVVYFLGRDVLMLSVQPGSETGGGDGPSFPGIDSEPSVPTASALEKRIEIINPAVEFSDIGGSAEAKQEMMRIYEDIVHPEKARYFGRDPDKRKGYLITGDSGCGKTLLVKALATKLKKDLAGKVKFYAASYDTFTSIWRGGEAQATAQLFELAKKNEAKNLKTLIFLDEMHVVGQRHREYNEALDTLLAHLDGMNKYTGLTFIGATYEPLDSLDKALVRRLDRHIAIAQPDALARADIFRIHIMERQKVAETAGNARLFSDLDYAALAAATHGLNGSHIERVVRAATDAKENKLQGTSAAELATTFTPITTEDIIAAIKTIPAEKNAGRMGFGQRNP